MASSHKDIKTRARNRGIAISLNRAQICPYCKSKPKYNKSKHQYICPKCGAKVNADKKGNPMGSVANKQLAYKRWYAHSMIEPLGKLVGRSYVYQYLDKVLGRSRYSTHTAKMSEVQLDILISILENTTAEKICERLGIKMKSEREEQWKNNVKAVVEEVLKEEFYPYKDMIKTMYRKQVQDKFVERLRRSGVSRWFKVNIEILPSKAGIIWLETPFLMYQLADFDNENQMISVMNQVKVPFKVWEGQNKPSFKQWVREYNKNRK